MKKLNLPDPRNVRDGGNSEEHRIEALVNERVAAAVKAATEPLHAQIEHLRSNRDTIIAEKRRLEGRVRKDAEDREAARPTAADFALTREQARDPQVYRRVKAEAAKHGLQPMILPDERQTRVGEPPDVYMSATHYHVYRPRIQGDAAAYQRHRAEAERRGLKFHCAYTAAEMPAAAFGGGDA